jgi:formate dehydrogenase iron-sulfur subunit
MPIGEGIHSTNQKAHDYVARGVTVGFFTDPTLCIGCKACEVACKEWNEVPGDGFAWTGNSYDNTATLGASTWRHVKFVEQEARAGRQVAGMMTGADGFLRDRAASAPASLDLTPGRELIELAMSSRAAHAPVQEAAFRWIFLSDVCRHCEVAGCHDACPTGAIVRTETGGVFVQDDICNGCGYCVASCPFGVIERRPEPQPGAGGAFKCTFCYDRQKSGMPPACAKACPTESIQFGPLDELRERARRRLDLLHVQGYSDAQIYDPVDTTVGGLHAFFLVPGDPTAFGLPRKPEAPRAYLRAAWTSAFMTAAAMIAAVLGAFLWTA